MGVKEDIEKCGNRAWSRLTSTLDGIICEDRENKHYYAERAPWHWWCERWRRGMVVKKVFPCECIDHKPDAGDGVYYGMPVLKVAGYHGKPLFEYVCPNCGRGGVGFQYPSVFKALRAWNEMQLEVWRLECCKPWSAEIKEDCPEWRREILEEMDGT